MKNFPDRLKSLRGEERQTDFARKLGVSVKTLQHYEYGTRDPSLEFIELLCYKLGASADWLLGLPHAEAPAAYPPPSTDVARLWALVESQQRVIEALSISPHVGSRRSASGAGEANGGVA